MKAIVVFLVTFGFVVSVLGNPLELEELEAMKCDDQGKLCRHNGGSAYECSVSVKACKDMIFGEHGRHTGKTSKNKHEKFEFLECDRQRRICRRMGGSVDECYAIVGACKKFV